MGSAIFLFFYSIQADARREAVEIYGIYFLFLHALAGYGRESSPDSKRSLGRCAGPPQAWASVAGVGDIISHDLSSHVLTGARIRWDPVGTALLSNLSGDARGRRIMKKSSVRRGTYGLTAMALLVVIATASAAYLYPALAAAACPGCYGLERIAPGLLVESDMPAGVQERLKVDVSNSEAVVRAYFGGFGGHPLIIACASEECDRRLGGRGARAMAYSTPFGTVIRLSPRGLNALIITHEFSHVEVHRRVGVWKIMTSAVPAWFDEGIAVIVSNDDRYLKPNASGPDRCIRDSGLPLPDSAFQWAPLSGKDPLLYADAACRVLHWMDVHGGKTGLIATLDALAAGQDLQP